MNGRPGGVFPGSQADHPHVGIERRKGVMCGLEDFGVEDTVAAADKVTCRCGGLCVSAAEVVQVRRWLDEDAVAAARRLRRLLDASPGDGGEGDWVLEAGEAGGDVD